MKHLYLQENNQGANNELIGKTIKDISFGLYPNEDRSCLIMTFTDDTYIYLKAEEYLVSSDSDYTTPQIRNHFAVPISCYASAPGYVYNGEFHYYPYIEEEIRMGLQEPDREREKQRVEECQRLEEEREYQTYLKLKEKFEK